MACYKRKLNKQYETYFINNMVQKKRSSQTNVNLSDIKYAETHKLTFLFFFRQIHFDFHEVQREDSSCIDMHSLHPLVINATQQENLITSREGQFISSLALVIKRSYGIGVFPLTTILASLKTEKKNTICIHALGSMTMSSNTDSMTGSTTNLNHRACTDPNKPLLT